MTFKKGVSGNPAGRPKGSRNRLSESFITDLEADWNEHGVEAIERMRLEDNTHYVKVVAGLIPRDIRVGKLDDLSIEELERRARTLGAALGLLGDVERSEAEAESHTTH